jgi:hypothetical protein
MERDLLVQIAIEPAPSGERAQPVQEDADHVASTRVTAPATRIQ